MNYSSEAHDLLNEALEILKKKKGAFAYPWLVGALMVHTSLKDAQEIMETVKKLEMEDNQ